jgi:hypothetical protein
MLGHGFNGAWLSAVLNEEIAIPARPSPPGLQLLASFPRNFKFDEEKAALKALSWAQSNVELIPTNLEDWMVA